MEAGNPLVHAAAFAIRKEADALTALLQEPRPQDPAWRATTRLLIESIGDEADQLLDHSRRAEAALSN